MEDSWAEADFSPEHTDESTVTHTVVLEEQYRLGMKKTVNFLDRRTFTRELSHIRALTAAWPSGKCAFRERG